MSGQGSSSSDSVVRVEVYLDDRPDALEVLTAQPFRFQLDTTALPEGPHTLRLVRIDAAGGRRERRLPFVVEHETGLQVEGLEPGSTVSGRVDVDVVTPAAQAPTPPPTRATGPSAWLYVVSTVLILGGIWVFFMLVPLYSRIAPAPSSAGKTASASSQAPTTPVDQTFLKAGEKLYGSDCAMCHKPSGEGSPPTFPALAGNSFLSGAGQVVSRIYDGAGAMPSHHSYTAKELAEVATYIRNTWGNDYGGVTVAQVTKAVPQLGGASQAPSSSAPSGSSQGAASAGAASGSAKPAGASGGSAAPAVDQALLQDGKKLYSSDCAGCHQPNGAGMPPTFPALADNSFLADPAAVMQRIFDGKGAMPSHPSYTDKDLAAVATYIRNAFGNSYGGVTVAEAAKAVPKAAQ